MVQYEGFHVFKIFVANPRKSVQVQKILLMNRPRAAGLSYRASSKGRRAMSSSSASASSSSSRSRIYRQFQYLLSVRCKIGVYWTLSFGMRFESEILL